MGSTAAGKVCGGTTLMACILIASGPEPLLSIARTPKLKKLVVVGIPLIRPVLDSVSPAGNGLPPGSSDQTTVPVAPLAVICTLYGAF